MFFSANDEWEKEEGEKEKKGDDTEARYQSIYMIKGFFPLKGRFDPFFSSQSA